MEHLKKSPWMLHYDASSCNGCDIEVLACTMLDLILNDLESSIPEILSMRTYY